MLTRTAKRRLPSAQNARRAVEAKVVRGRDGVTDMTQVNGSPTSSSTSSSIIPITPFRSGTVRSLKRLQGPDFDDAMGDRARNARDLFDGIGQVGGLDHGEPGDRQSR